MSDELPAESYGSVPSLKSILFNILAVFFLVLTCLCPLFSAAVFIAPNSALNPLPPGGVSAEVFPTNTNTSVYVFPPTWTPTATLELSATPTLPEKGTPEPSDTLVYNPYPQDTPKSFFPFVVEGGNPTYSASSKGCTWLGVEGAVFDLAHAPIDNLLVVLRGTLSGQSVDMEQITGSASDELSGEFEFRLADKPILSLNALSIQLLDGTRNPISDRIVFNTYAACDRNLIRVNFIQINPPSV
jgi:hypothetical protein